MLPLIIKNHQILPEITPMEIRAIIHDNNKSPNILYNLVLNKINVKPTYLDTVDSLPNV
jgi:hypothetical protein